MFCIDHEECFVFDRKQDIPSFLLNFIYSLLLPWVLAFQDELYYNLPRNLARVMLQIMFSWLNAGEMNHHLTMLTQL